MGKRKLRKIVVDGLEYAWRFSPGYERLDLPWVDYRCFDIFVAYRWGCQASPVHIHFITWEDAAVGGPLRTGLPLVLGKPETAGVNLHTPRWAAALIRKALERGWEPSTPGRPLVIEQGIELLAELGCLTMDDATDATSAADQPSAAP